MLRCIPLHTIADHFFTAGDLQLRGDETEWAAVAGAAGVCPDRLLRLRQVHRANAVVARRGRTGAWNDPEADIILSDDPTSAVCVRVADCAPVLLADRRIGAVAAAHAGWRGTVQRAAVVAVEAMAREFGSEPADLVAAIGPCLGPCCGEVGAEVVQAFRDAGHGQQALERWFTDGPSGRPYLDLWRANADQLESAGLPVDQIHVARLCSKTYAGVLHSYRANSDRAGRMAAVITSR